MNISKPATQAQAKSNNLQRTKISVPDCETFVPGKQHGCGTSGNAMRAFNLPRVINTGNRPRHAVMVNPEA